MFGSRGHSGFCGAGCSKGYLHTNGRRRSKHGLPTLKRKNEKSFTLRSTESRFVCLLFSSQFYVDLPASFYAAPLAKKHFFFHDILVLAGPPSQSHWGGFHRFQAGSTVESPGGAIEQSASVYSEKIGAGSGVVADEVAGKMHAASNPSRERRDLAEFFEDQATTGVRVATNNANIGKAEEGASGYRGPAVDGSRGNDNVGRRSAAVLRTQSPYIGALGYHVGEDSGSSRRVVKSCEPLGWTLLTSCSYDK